MDYAPPNEAENSQSLFINGHFFDMMNIGDIYFHKFYLKPSLSPFFTPIFLNYKTYFCNISKTGLIPWIVQQQITLEVKNKKQKTTRTITTTKKKPKQNVHITPRI